jgi:hypothetical protein
MAYTSCRRNVPGQVGGMLYWWKRMGWRRLTWLGGATKQDGAEAISDTALSHLHRTARAKNLIIE